MVQERARRRIQTSSRIIVPCRLLTLIITFLTFLTCGVSLHVVSKNGLVPAPFFSQNTNFHYKKGIYKELALFSCLCPFAFVFFSPQTQSKWHMLTAYCFRLNSKHTQRETLRIRGSTGNKPMCPIVRGDYISGWSIEGGCKIFSRSFSHRSGVKSP